MVLFALQNVIYGLLGFTAMTGTLTGKPDELGSRTNASISNHSFISSNNGMMLSTTAPPEPSLSTTTVFDTITPNATTSYFTITVTDTNPTTQYFGITATTTMTDTKTTTRYSGGTTTTTETATRKITAHAPSGTNFIRKKVTSMLGEFYSEPELLINPSGLAIGVHRTAIMFCMITGLLAIFLTCFMAYFGGRAMFWEGRAIHRAGCALKYWRRTRAWHVDRVQRHVEQSRRERDEAIAARDEANRRADKLEGDCEQEKSQHHLRSERVQQVVEKLFRFKIPPEYVDQESSDNLQALLDRHARLFYKQEFARLKENGAHTMDLQKSD
ncbi:hypothetical protein DE146DRAFT_258743 [Phaeosphaeria sp. MPI-PUGE-AT-0046c]|nr:hypothetical protein DE146DRAFT_258743 [Phaeosphaeria sp. MPI-PUGE-AT-0046c]